MPDTSHVLRPMEHRDLAAVLQWRNHSNVRRFMFSTKVISAEDHLAWFEATHARSDTRLFILDNLGIPIGFSRLDIEGNAAHRAQWGFYRSPEARSGTGVLLCKETLRFGFTVMQLHKVYGEVLAGNSPSISLHQKLGFSREGYLKEHHVDGEIYSDVLIFGMTRPQWEINMEWGKS